MNEQIGKMKAQLKYWGKELDKLAEKAERADNDVKTIYYRQIDNLKAKYHVASSKLDEAKSGGIEKWDEFKSGIEHAWKDIEKAFRSFKR